MQGGRTCCRGPADIPKKSIAGDLRTTGVHTPADVAAMRRLRCMTRCARAWGSAMSGVLDTLLAVAGKDFMNGGPAQWWHFNCAANKLIPDIGDCKCLPKS
jgi:hypothetical protein